MRLTLPTGEYVEEIHEHGDLYYVEREGTVYRFADSAALKARIETAKAEGGAVPRIDGLAICKATDAIQALAAAQAKIKAFLEDLGWAGDALRWVGNALANDGLASMVWLLLDEQGDKITGEMMLNAAVSAIVGGAAAKLATKGLGAAIALFPVVRKQVGDLIRKFLGAAEGAKVLERAAKTIAQKRGRKLSRGELEKLKRDLADRFLDAVEKRRVGTYREMKNLGPSVGLGGSFHAHHLVERRAIEQWGKRLRLSKEKVDELVDDAPALVLEKATHLKHVHDALQAQLKHGKDYSLGDYFVAYKQVYEEIGEAVLPVDQFFARLVREGGGKFTMKQLEKDVARAAAARGIAAPSLHGVRESLGTPWGASSGTTVQDILEGG